MNDNVGQPMRPTAGQPGAPIEQCSDVAGQAPHALSVNDPLSRDAVNAERARLARENKFDGRAAQANRPTIGQPGYVAPTE